MQSCNQELPWSLTGPLSDFLVSLVHGCLCAVLLLFQLLTCLPFITQHTWRVSV